VAGLFLLSILEPWAGKIRSGTKTWELRENPRFGIFPEAEMEVGDRVFIVTVPEGGRGEGAATPAISCMAEVTSVLREREFQEFFGDLETGHFLAAGFAPSEWERFRTEVLPVYRTAVGVRPFPIESPIPVSRFRHRHTGRAWNGRGCLPVSHLKRYALDGRSLESALGELARELAGESEDQ
jgi:hypothetical protein